MEFLKLSPRSRQGAMHPAGSLYEKPVDIQVCTVRDVSIVLAYH